MVLPMIDIDADAIALAVQMMDKDGNLPDYVHAQAAACEQRRIEARNAPCGTKHHCLSYVHCYWTGRVPVCPISVVRVWKERLNGKRPAVQAIEYYPDGKLKRVEFNTEANQK